MCNNTRIQEMHFTTTIRKQKTQEMITAIVVHKY